MSVMDRTVLPVNIDNFDLDMTYLPWAIQEFNNSLPRFGPSAENCWTVPITNISYRIVSLFKTEAGGLAAEIEFMSSSIGKETKKLVEMWPEECELVPVGVTARYENEVCKDYKFLTLNLRLKEKP